MSISAEALASQAYILRGHADGRGYGDEFSWSMVAVINGDYAHLKGLTATPHAQKKDRRDVMAWLVSMGVKRIRCERLKNGKMICMEFSVK